MPTYNVFIDGKPIEVELKKEDEECFTAKLEGRTSKIRLPKAKISPKEEFTVQIDGESYRVKMSEVSRETPFNVKVAEVTFKVQLKAPPRKSTETMESAPSRFLKKTAGSKEVSADTVVAPMTGRILKIHVEEGGQVTEGQILCILEAMKMENEIAAPKKGAVQEICTEEGSPVNEGDTLFVIS